jgi:hypothetical protein
MRLLATELLELGNEELVAASLFLVRLTPDNFEIDFLI